MRMTCLHTMRSFVGRMEGSLVSKITFDNAGRRLKIIGLLYLSLESKRIQRMVSNFMFQLNHIFKVDWTSKDYIDIVYRLNLKNNAIDFSFTLLSCSSSAHADESKTDCTLQWNLVPMRITFVQMQFHEINEKKKRITLNTK